MFSISSKFLIVCSFFAIQVLLYVQASAFLVSSYNKTCMAKKEQIIKSFEEIENASSKLNQTIDSLFEKYTKEPCN